MPTLRELLMAGDSKSGSYRPATLSDVLLPVGDSKEETLAKLERAREFMGLPTYVEQLRRQEAGQTPVNPLEVLQAATSPIESVTAAPARAAAAKAQEANKLSEVVDAFKEQMGKDPKAASSGEAMAEKAGLEGKAAKTVGIGLDLALDPTNLLGAGATKAAIPLLGLVGALKAQREAKAAEVLAKPGALGFYSKLEDLVLQKMGKSATPEQVMAIAKGAKEEEVAASGLEQLLKGKDKVSKDEVLQQIRSQRPQLQEIVKGSETKQLTFRTVGNRLESGGGEFWIEPNTNSDKYNWTLYQKGFGPLTHSTHKENLIAEAQKVANYEAKTTKFDQLVEPGGKNYKETLITLPKSEQSFKSSHWDEPNVIAHARTNERVDTSGNKLFHIEEIQSDWHQAGRKKGYKSTEITPDFAKNFFGIKDELWQTLTDAEKQSYVDEIKQGGETVRRGMRELVPDAPFKKSWQELTAKKMIQDAVASGADRMSWTPGALQAERYDLSKQIDRIEYKKSKREPDKFLITAIDTKEHSLGGEMVMSPDEITDFLGKDIADKIIKGEANKEEQGYKILSGTNLSVGGEGQKGFYDKILPDFLRKFGKKYGAEVSETTIESEGKKIKVPYLNLTPELKAAVIKEGLPLFGAGAIALPAVVEQMRKQQEAR